MEQEDDTRPAQLRSNAEPQTSERRPRGRGLKWVFGLVALLLVLICLFKVFSLIISSIGPGSQRAETSSSERESKTLENRDVALDNTAKNRERADDAEKNDRSRDDKQQDRDRGEQTNRSTRNDSEETSRGGKNAERELEPGSQGKQQSGQTKSLSETSSGKTSTNDSGSANGAHPELIQQVVSEVLESERAREEARKSQQGPPTSSGQ